jgi:hypothetical protein
MIESALEYAENGWRVFPVEPNGKRPLIKDWPNAATTDNEQLKTWWGKWPTANIGLACGSGSGVFVVDVDVSDGKQGAESWATIGAFTETLESHTGSGGAHLFFLYPKGKEIKNKQNAMPGIDVRGEGGFVVLPPSVHANGQEYQWENETEPIECPESIFNTLFKQRAKSLPWDRKPNAPAPQRPVSTPVIERASAYLRNVPPAVQGQAGHSALLWAARCLVVGFELSESDALSLLWSEYNPRCAPPWDRGNPQDVKEFERKVKEARETPSQRPRGWLLHETGLQNDTDAMASILSESFAECCRARFFEHAKRTENKEAFPMHCFPEPVKAYVETVADVQVVSPDGIALSVLVAAGAAMGNAFRLRLKNGFNVPPTLWGAIISASGTNKSGPFREIIKPLRASIPYEILQNKMMNPQGQLLIEDATTEAVIGVMAGAPRGLCLANGEGAGWIGSFDRYSQGKGKKTSVDETIWLKLWDGDPYQKNRKTDSENILIHNATCGVLVCIQPKKMAECFDPGQFASGLVPRLLVVYLPKEFRGWSESEMTGDKSSWWTDTIMKLRSYPFLGQDPNTGEYMPNQIDLSAEAKAVYVDEFNRIARQIMESDEMTDLFLGKQQGMTGRVALVLHGLGAACGMHEMDSELSGETMGNAIEIMKYLVNQQLSVYSLASKAFESDVIDTIIGFTKENNGVMTPRLLTRKKRARWGTIPDAIRDLKLAADAGHGEWNAATSQFKLCEKKQ